MKTTIQEQGQEVIVHFEGRLDTEAADKAEQELKPVFTKTGCDIILDCNQLEYIASKGLRLFLKICKTSTANGCHPYLRGLSTTVHDVFVVTGFINFFEFK
jgi:anti-sigma B factor antagonist